MIPITGWRKQCCIISFNSTEFRVRFSYRMFLRELPDGSFGWDNTPTIFPTHRAAEKALLEAPEPIVKF